MKAAALSALVILASLASAQDHITVTAYSIFVKNGAIPASCQGAVNIAADALLAYPHPARWSFIVVCDEPSWAIAVRKMGSILPADHLRGITDQSGRITLLRGAIFDGSTGMSGEAIIAHELAHIALQSHDDLAVERLADRWVKARHATELASR